MKKQNDKKRRSVAKRASALFGALIVIVSVLTIPLGAVSPNINQSWLSWYQIYSDTPTTIKKTVVSFGAFSSDPYNYANPFRIYLQHYNGYEMGDGSAHYYVSYELLSLGDGSHFYVSMTETNGGLLSIGWYHPNDSGVMVNEILHQQAYEIYGVPFEIFAKYCLDGDDLLLVVDVLLNDGTHLSKEHRIPNQSFKIQVKGQNANVDFASTETDLIFELYGIPTQIKSSDYQDGYEAGLAAGKQEGYDEGYDAGFEEGLSRGDVLGYFDGFDDAYAYIKKYVNDFIGKYVSPYDIPAIDWPVHFDYQTGPDANGIITTDWESYWNDIAQTAMDAAVEAMYQEMYWIWDTFYGLFDYSTLWGLEDIFYEFGLYAKGAGMVEGEELGYNNGYNAGYNVGYLEGLRNEWQGKLIALLREKGVIVSDGASPSEVFKALYDYGWTACADQGSVTQRIIFTALEAPVNIVLGAMNFDVFGVNIAGAIYTILAMVVALFILRIVIDIIV